MILELATLSIRPGRCTDFEAAFAQAKDIIASMPGYPGHELQRCVEDDHQYLMLVRWRSLEDSTVGFRQSPQYKRWSAQLHHFCDPFPEVMHYRVVGGCGGSIDMGHIRTMTQRMPIGKPVVREMRDDARY